MLKMLIIWLFQDFLKTLYGHFQYTLGSFSGLSWDFLRTLEISIDFCFKLNIYITQGNTLCYIDIQKAGAYNNTDLQILLQLIMN